MIAIINVINSPSFTERGLNLSTKQKSSLSSHLFLPQKETEICGQDKNDSTAPSWCSSLLFGSLCLYWDDTGESINTKAKGSGPRHPQAAPWVSCFLGILPLSSAHPSSDHLYFQVCFPC